MASPYLMIIGILFIIVGAVTLGVYNAVATSINQSTSPNPISNSVGQSEGNFFGLLGWLLIIVGVILFIGGMFIE